jgi:hypothetical protein
MRPLEQLINVEDSAVVLLREWFAAAVRPVEMLPPSEFRGEALYQTQVTTRSPMGAVVYETGGILIDHGWLRILGSGNPRLRRTLPGWNHGRGDGFFLVADDAIGGFFAMNGGALGPDPMNIYYLAPESLAWEPLKINYSQFLVWAAQGKMDLFYEWIRWSGWEQDIAHLPGDRCFFFYPFLWNVEGDGATSRRGDIPVQDAWYAAMEARKKLRI